jgi:PPOX class probable F420-dependent enzyme
MLTAEELKQFLTDQPHIMKLATLSPDGWPSVNPLWYSYDGETFTVAGRRQAAWVANIRNDPRVSACIDTYEAPYVRVLIRATAEIVDDNWFVQSPERSIRYLGAEAGQAYFESKKHIPRVLIRINPINIISWTGDWHPRYLT